MSAQASRSPDYIVALTSHRAILHFGLRWTPLIGSRLANLARRRARAARASHYVYCGERGVSLALARLPRTPRHWRCISAAAVFAAHHATGAVLWQALLPDGRYWLVGARDGAVITRTDCIFDTWADLCLATSRLTTEDPSLLVLAPQDWAVPLADDALTGGSVTAGQGDALACGRATVLASDNAVSCGAAALPSDATAPGSVQDTDLPARLMRLAERVPPMQPLQWHDRADVRSALALGVLGIGVAATSWHEATPPVSEAPRFADTLADQAGERAAIPTQTLQDRVLAAWQGAEEYVAAVSALRALPVTLDGWRLAGAQCDWAPVQWTCAADYRRETPDATNLDLLRRAPSDHHVRFTPLSVAHVTWSVPAPPAPLAIAGFPDADWVDAELVSALQSHAAAFTHITVGARISLDSGTLSPSTSFASAAHPALAQTVDLAANGMSLARPPGRRPLSIDGPLRSLGMLADVAGPVSWQQVALRLQQGVTPGLARSALHIGLKGWIHEK